MHFGNEEHCIDGSGDWMLKRGKQFKPAVERSQHKVRFNENCFARPIDLRFELPWILIAPSREDHGMTVAEEFNELFRISGAALHFAGLGNDPKSAKNV